MRGPSQVPGGAPSGIPTVYRGVQYRSRLEAKWAAFFDLLGWPYQYEPFDLGGWIPDFLLMGRVPVLVEVKPVFEFPQDVAAKIVAARPEQETMIVGCAIGKLEPQYMCARLGHMISLGCVCREQCGGKHATGVGVSKNDSSRRLGLYSLYGSPCDRISGRDDGQKGFTWALCSEIEPIWAKAGNLVQWRGVQNRGV
jgi:hypothetical protein